ncbi:hypothetical protein D0868_06744 [Hortaea werneckii]|uniref:DNA-directed RNA polymerase RBP11-like dimerisation domain-containing protein n=1 Tax=Hortaea werneckii TaxID=91943 RepID=A0A3M6YPZ7_HORWE|nr:hypothetical protein D0868_06744 [Hortaea werneckii]
MNAPDRGHPPRIAFRTTLETMPGPDDPETPTKPGGRLPPHIGAHAIRLSTALDPRVHGAIGPTSLEAEPSPFRHELFLLQEGEKKITFEPETRVPNAVMFTFNKEDHTLGNLLRAKLVKSPHVIFAAYQVPHPLFAVFNMRVQTDGELSPRDAVVQACKDLVGELEKLDQEFTKEWELKKIATQGVDM